ncbi:MAG: hypothetical protein WC933_01475 [Candidatus Paceibacterota bacterium]|jgi:hypothetical protein
MQNEDKEFKDYMETLPPEIKQAIYSIDYPQKLQEIVKNNKLMIDQAGKLEAETTLVMAGIEPMDKYVKNLMGNVGLSSIQASVVAHDVNESIFKNIRESLKKINDQMIEEEKVLNEANKEKPLTSSEQPTIQNQTAPELHLEMQKEGIEIGRSNLPEIAPKAEVPMVSSTTLKPTEPFHVNIPPVANIVETKLNNTVAVPKETITIEEKTKLPEKPQTGGDPYREAIM